MNNRPNLWMCLAILYGFVCFALGAAVCKHELDKVALRHQSTQQTSRITTDTIVAGQCVSCTYTGAKWICPGMANDGPTVTGKKP